jgi:hypothetical protein
MFLGHDFYQNFTSWVDSSPSGGFQSYDPYVTKTWGGDDHIYNYYMDCENYDDYAQSNFVSEFGF